MLIEKENLPECGAIMSSQESSSDPVDKRETVLLEDVCVFLAAYASPPKYALEHVCTGAPTANDLSEAWKYHFRQLKECGLFE